MGTREPPSNQPFITTARVNYWTLLRDVERLWISTLADIYAVSPSRLRLRLNVEGHAGLTDLLNKVSYVEMHLLLGSGVPEA